MTTGASIADPRFSIQNLLTYKIPVHDLADHGRLSLLWDGFRTRHAFKHRATANSSDRLRYSHILDALKTEEEEHKAQRRLVAGEWGRLIAGGCSSTADERTLSECFNKIPKEVEVENESVRERYPPYYPQPKLRIDMSDHMELDETGFEEAHDAVLYVPVGFCPSKYYLGHVGGDYIFRYDSFGNGHSYASPERFVFDGMVPRPQREYLMRFQISVLPRVVDMIIGILAFLPASPDFIHPNLQAIRNNADYLSARDILYLVGIWTAKFCDPATGAYSVPECLRLTGPIVEELGWLWERLDCLQLFGHLNELKTLVEKATGQSTPALSVLWDQRLAAEARRILFDEGKYGDEVLVYKLCSGRDCEVWCFLFSLVRPPCPPGGVFMIRDGMNKQFSGRDWLPQAAYP